MGSKPDIIFYLFIYLTYSVLNAVLGACVGLNYAPPQFTC